MLARACLIGDVERNMKEDTIDLIRIGGTIVLLFLACAAFYYSLFWGWASGAGFVKQPVLKTASNVALAVSFLSFWTSVGIWLVPYLLKKRKSTTDNSGAAPRRV